MPELTVDQLSMALAAVGGVALIGLLLTLVLALRLRRVRREYAVLLGEGRNRDLIGTVGAALKRIEAMEQRVDGAITRHHELEAVQRLALQRFHMVRYDAFDDMGGRLSFSAALLDDHGDGLVITSINGRTETRTYAKPIKNLASDHNLSDEEREAIAGAVAAYNRGELAAQSR